MTENYFGEKCDFKRGEYVNSRYRMEKVLGEGSFGLVLKVLDVRDNQPYAMKILPLWKRTNEEKAELVQRFNDGVGVGRNDTSKFGVGIFRVRKRWTSDSTANG